MPAKIKFELLVTYYRIHKRTLLLLGIICVLTNFTELQLTNIPDNYWGVQMHCGPPNQNFGGAMAPVTSAVAPPMGLKYCCERLTMGEVKFC